MSMGLRIASLVVLLVAVGCDGSSPETTGRTTPPGSSAGPGGTTLTSCTDVAAAGPTSWLGASTVQFAATPGAKITVDKQYDSTAGVLNRWDIGGQLEPLTAQWPTLSASVPVTACWLRGSFTASFQRQFTNALVESVAGISKLVVAGSPQQPVRITKPPRS